MNTFTHILAKINWLDVAMLGLLIRIVFIGVKTGFVTELFKLLGVICGLFAGLHYYMVLAIWVGQKTGCPIENQKLAFFVLMVSVVMIAVTLFRNGFLMVFKFETANEGVNQWGSGVLSVIRALFLASLIMFGLLLTHVEWVQKQIFTSISHNLALKAGPNTYSFLYHNLVGKLFSKERFNAEVFNVITHK